MSDRLGIQLRVRRSDAHWLLLVIALSLLLPFERVVTKTIHTPEEPEEDPLANVSRPVLKLGALRFGGDIHVPGEIRIGDLRWGGDLRRLAELERRSDELQRARLAKEKVVESTPSTHGEALWSLRAVALLLWATTFALQEKLLARLWDGVRWRIRAAGTFLAKAFALEPLDEYNFASLVEGSAASFFSLQAAHAAFEDDLVQDLHAPGLYSTTGPGPGLYMTGAMCGQCDGRLGRRETFMGFGRGFCSEECREVYAQRMLDACPSSSPKFSPATAPQCAPPLALPRAVLGEEGAPVGVDALHTAGVAPERHGAMVRSRTALVSHASEPHRSMVRSHTASSLADYVPSRAGLAASNTILSPRVL